MYDFWTLEDFKIVHSTVLLRVDINSPLDPNTGEILNDYRIRLHAKTILELVKQDAKVVVMAHQSRPGKRDFSSLEHHARRLSKYIGEVKFVDEVASSRVIREIEEMDYGEVILLENVRMLSEEMVLENSDFEVQANAYYVKKLSPYFEFYINDAFAAAHRSQPSLVGFPLRIPGGAGPIMEHEIESLEKVLNFAEHPKIADLGGAKIKDSLKITHKLLEEFNYDKILAGGLFGALFALADGKKIGKATKEILQRECDLKKSVEDAKALLKKFGDKILYPVDFAVNKGGTRIEVRAEDEKPGPIYDIGLETVSKFKEIISGAKAIILNGPMGVFELPLFAIGTYEIVNAIAMSDGFKVAGGGHTVSVIELLKLEDHFDHISTGGGATIAYLARSPMPAL